MTFGGISGQTPTGDRLRRVKRVTVVADKPVNLAFFTFNPVTHEFERFGRREKFTTTTAGNMPFHVADDPFAGWSEHERDMMDRFPQGPGQRPGNRGFGSLGTSEEDGGGIVPGGGNPIDPWEPGGEWAFPPEDPWWEPYDPEPGDSLGGLVIPGDPFEGWKPLPLPVQPWWWPDNFRLFYSGNKGDKVPGRAGTPGGGNPDPDAGNLGWRAEGPFIQFGWTWGEHEVHELFCGFAATHRKSPTMPSWWPSSDHHYDDSGRVGYRYWPLRGMGMVCGGAEFGVGAGTYLQWTHDGQAGGQSNPWGETHGDNHFKPYFEVVIKWDTGLFSDFLEISIEFDDTGDVRMAGGIGWGI